MIAVKRATYRSSNGFKIKYYCLGFDGKLPALEFLLIAFNGDLHSIISALGGKITRGKLE